MKNYYNRDFGQLAEPNRPKFGRFAWQVGQHQVCKKSYDGKSQKNAIIQFRAYISMWLIASLKYQLLKKK